MSFFNYLDSCSSVVSYHEIPVKFGMVVLPSDQKSIFSIFMNFVKLEKSITSNTSFCNCHNTIFNVLMNVIHQEKWVCAVYLDPIQTLCNVTSFDLSLISFMNFHSWSINLVNFVSEYKRFTVLPLTVNANYTTFEDFRVTYFDHISWFTLDQNTSSFEI